MVVVAVVLGVLLACFIAPLASAAANGRYGAAGAETPASDGCSLQFDDGDDFDDRSDLGPSSFFSGLMIVFFIVPIAVFGIIFFIIIWAIKNRRRGMATTTNPAYSPGSSSSHSYPPAPVTGSPARRSYPQQQQYNLVVQNIGHYVAGDNVDIRDSVVQRSQFGGGGGGGSGSGNGSGSGSARLDRAAQQRYITSASVSAAGTVPEDRPALYEQYKQILSAALEDGFISVEEERLLTRIRQRGNLTYHDHKRALEELEHEGTTAWQQNEY